MSSRKMETSHRILLSVLVVVAIIDQIGHAAAATYTVGDSLGWTIPPGGAAAYVTWASQYTFHVGDVLVFDFTTGSHDVAQVIEDSFDACSGTNPIAMYSTSPANVALDAAGDYYFFCTFGRHCSLGQKLTVSVTGNSSTSMPPPPPLGSPSTPPPSRSSSTPPPPRPANSALMVSIGRFNMFSVIFISIFVAGILIV